MATLTLPVLAVVAQPPTVIPRILHQVWVGGEVPTWIRAAWSTWDEHLERDGGWTIKRWTDIEVAAHPGMARVATVGGFAGLSWRALSDLIRIVAVYQYGGVYADNDSVPLLPLDDWVGERPGWTAIPEGHGNRAINNAVFGFPPHHPFLYRVWTLAQEQIQRGVTNDHYIAGPQMFRKALEAKQDIEVVRWDAARRTWQGAMSDFLYPDKRSLRDEFPDIAVLHYEWPHRRT